MACDSGVADSAPSKKNVSPLDTGEDKRASLGGGAPRRRQAPPPPITAGHHDTRKFPVQSGGELPKSGSLHPTRGRDKKDRELYPGGFLDSLEALLLVCWALLVVGHRSWLAGSFVGSWLRSLDSGSWVRVIPWWVVLERSSWGSPFPSTDSELHKCESVKPHEAARYPTRL